MSAAHFAQLARRIRVLVCVSKTVGPWIPTPQVDPVCFASECSVQTSSIEMRPVTTRDIPAASRSPGRWALIILRDSCTTTGHSGISSTPVKPASYPTPSQSLCSGKTRHSKNTRSASSTKQYAGSSSASMKVYPTAASDSRSSRTFSTSIDTLVSLLSSLQTQPTSILSSACACVEASPACTTATSTTTAIITQAQTIVVTVAVLSTVTSTATSVTTFTERAVVTTTVISLAGTITDTVTQTLPSFTRSTVTATSTVTETARPPRPTICASNKLFELYAGQRLNTGEGVRQTGGGTGYSPADCASRCAISVTCGGFNHLGPANACIYYSTSPANGGNQVPNDPALARSLGPAAGYTAGIYVGPC